MKYGISFEKLSYYSVSFWWGCRMFKVYPKTKNGWVFKVIKFNLVYGLRHLYTFDIFLGVETKESYPE